MWGKIKKKLNIDSIVDVSVDLFLILFDVLSSPILIVMRLLRWFVGKYMLDGLKNKIKKLIHWTEGKPPLLQIFVWTMTIVFGLTGLCWCPTTHPLLEIGLITLDSTGGIV